MRKVKKAIKTELLHIELTPEIKKSLREEAKKRNCGGMSGLVSNILYERYNPPVKQS